MVDASDPSPIGEWTPDLGEFGNPGPLLLQNCISQGEIYKPFSSLSEATDALPALCQGAFAYRDRGGNTIIIAGTSVGLYQLNGTGWTEVTRLNGAGPTLLPYNGSVETFWNFCSFGTLIIATNYNDDIQVFDTTSSTNFEQLSATAPRCRTMFVYRNFLICLDTVDGDGAIGYRIRWSSFNDPRGDWTPDPNTQADFDDIIEDSSFCAFGADVQDYGVIVKGKSMYRLDYVGGDDIFTITKIDTGRGSILPRSCTTNGRSIFLLGEDGYYQYDGVNMMPIGDGKIDKFFYKNFDENFDYNLNVVIDPLKKNVLWAFTSLNATNGVCDFIMCFNYVTQRWTIINLETECLFSFLSQGYTIDSLTTLYPNLDLIPYSLDSRIWTAGKTVLGGFSPAHKMGAFAGDTLPLSVHTAEVRLNSSQRSTLHNIIPYITGGAISARIGIRNRLVDDPEFTDFVNQNSMTGEIDFLHDAVYHRAEILVTGNWTTAVATAYRAEPSGVN